ncbi:hypothetical protein SAMD00019534_043620 [Acytostelium subglobosum LB1]|uniref:hypothetical protein n=1 Tax=Acytostelium subglobosum LB1 TaxID=1410327 RepID=UPI000644F26E|nr:hypothetical protein SAMD00019534_043620 [Acytostelium subglobosum LB1]GAM21187.1 hypothetical protein SAMD00019534_043620 [Acytostelium subglobosum LB1]|eukprot:XP_012756321.1 hypothetical protein SAMD00019534_043620 [Acytostelium subglobosum LB1]
MSLFKEYYWDENSEFRERHKAYIKQKTTKTLEEIKQQREENLVKARAARKKQSEYILYDSDDDVDEVDEQPQQQQPPLKPKRKTTTVSALDKKLDDFVSKYSNDQSKIESLLTLMQPKPLSALADNGLGSDSGRVTTKVVEAPTPLVEIEPTTTTTTKTNPFARGMTPTATFNKQSDLLRHKLMMKF